MPAIEPKPFETRNLADVRDTFRRPGAQTGPMAHNLGVRQRGNQFHSRGLEAFQRRLGRGLVEPFMFQRTADQNVPVTPRDRVAAFARTMLDKKSDAHLYKIIWPLTGSTGNDKLSLPSSSPLQAPAASTT